MFLSTFVLYYKCKRNKSFNIKGFASKFNFFRGVFMNKTELVEAVAEKMNTTKKEAEAAVSAFTETVKEALAEGKKVQLVGFGSFEVRERSARKGRNPQTGEEMDIPATKVPAFKPGKGFKDVVK